MKVLMVPSTLRDGAVSCRTVAREGSASARRVKALPSPAFMPPEATSLLHDAANQLQRSAIAAERDAIFLLGCSHLGLMADGPFGAVIAITLPPLLSPWPMPTAAKRHDDKLGGLLHALGAPVRMLVGAGEELYTTVQGLKDTAIALEAHRLDAIIPGLSDHIPYVGQKRRQFDAGVKWAYDHPGQFFTMLGKDTIAYKQWSEHHYANAIGHNAMGLAELLLAVGKLGKGSIAARGAKGDAETAAGAVRGAKAKHDALTRPRGAAGDYAATQRASWLQVKHDGEVQQAAQRIETARQHLEAATHKLEAARAARNDAASEAALDTAKELGKGAARVLNEPPEAGEGASLEPAR
jgi:hypothetical protein